MSGTLFVVGTPIGNLGDITLRALETLKSVEHLAAEDTRRTRALLSHFGITGKKLYSFEAHSGPGKTTQLVELLAAGQALALVTDAGMPSVSDPGQALVAAAIERGLPVVVIPGPSAVTTAVVLSGLVSGSFLFLGFLPRQGGKRKAALAQIQATAEPVVLFEAPQRTADTLADLAEHMPNRQAVICRELTKLHEEARRGSLAELAAQASEFRGEITLVLGAFEPAITANSNADGENSLQARITTLFEKGASARSIVEELKASAGLPRRELYELVQAQAKVLAAAQPASDTDEE